MAGKPKSKYKAVLPDPLPKNTYPDNANEYTKAWLALENAAIDVAEDLGLKSFGGGKIGVLRDAIMKLRIERCKDECRELFRIAKEGDRTPEAEAFVKRLKQDAQRILEAEERLRKKDAGAN